MFSLVKIQSWQKSQNLKDVHPAHTMARGFSACKHHFIQIASHSSGTNIDFCFCLFVSFYFQGVWLPVFYSDALRSSVVRRSWWGDVLYWF